MNQDDTEAAIWLQKDAAFLYQCAREYGSCGDAFLAARVQQNAAYSAKLARERLGIEDAGSAR